MNATNAGGSGRTILVASATGNQGRAVTRALLARGINVRALTRDPDNPAARTLADRGAEPVQGDLYDPDSLTPLLDDVDGVFGLSDFWTEGYDGQVEQVTNLARAAAEAGVDHFVMSGVAGSERDTGVPHFDSCDEIEQNIRALGLRWTFVRPVFFMQNFESFYEDIIKGTLAFPIQEDTNHQMVDIEDIGRVTAQIFADPDRHARKAYALGGDEGTLAEIAAVFGSVIGTDIEPFYVPIDQAREAFGDESADMCQWFIDDGFKADIPALNEEFGHLTTLREYLEREGWSPEKSAPNFTTSWAEKVLAG